MSNRKGILMDGQFRVLQIRASLTSAGIVFATQVTVKTCRHLIIKEFMSKPTL